MALTTSYLTSTKNFEGIMNWTIVKRVDTKK